MVLRLAVLMFAFVFCFALVWWFGIEMWCWYSSVGFPFVGFRVFIMCLGLGVCLVWIDAGWVCMVAWLLTFACVLGRCCVCFVVHGFRVGLVN